MSYVMSYLEMVYFNMTVLNMTKEEAEAEANAVLERRKRDWQDEEGE